MDATSSSASFAWPWFGRRRLPGIRGWLLVLVLCGVLPGLAVGIMIGHRLDSADWAAKLLAAVGLAMVPVGALVAWRIARDIQSTATAATLGTGAAPPAGHPPAGVPMVRELHELALALHQAQGLIDRQALDQARRIEAEQLRDQALAAKAAADRSSLAKSKLIAAASHDLRQPVQSLLLLIHVLTNELKGDGPHPVLHQMEQALNALTVLLNRMLDLSKLDAGLIAPQPQPVSLGDLLARLGAEYRLRSAERGLTFRVRANDLHVVTDPTLVERILRNMIENALRYTPEGGVLVACRRRGGTGTGASRLGGTIRLDVIDTGIGIAPDQAASIFEEFYQVANPDRDQSQGLGLGLAIVQRMVHLLGGRIFVRSVPGRGSAFSVTFPAVDCAPPEPAPDPEPAAVKPAATAGRRILVVEDDGTLRQSLVLMLESWGYRPTAAHDGGLAVALVETGGERPDVILADYRLSGALTGIDVIRRVSALLQRRLPALLITGDTAPDRLFANGSATAEGNADFRLVHKPVRVDALRRALEEAVHAADSHGGTSAPLPSPTPEQPAMPDAVSTLDTARLADLAMALLPHQLQFLYTSLAPELSEEADRLVQAVRAGDWPAVRDGAHRIKGKAFNFGLSAVGGVAEAIETQCGRGDHRPIAPLADQLAQAATAAAQAIAAVFPPALADPPRADQVEADAPASGPP